MVGTLGFAGKDNKTSGGKIPYRWSNKVINSIIDNVSILFQIIFIVLDSKSCNKMHIQLNINEILVLYKSLHPMTSR